MCRFPPYLMLAVLVYSCFFLLYLGYSMIPVISLGLANMLFYALSVVVFLPMILFLLYLFDEKIPLLKQHEQLLRIAIAALALVAVLICLSLIPIL